MFCPNINSPEYKELAAALNSDNKAHYLWDLNEGNHLIFTPNGVQSKLFNALAEASSKEEALKDKSLIYTDLFNEWFGKWKYGLVLKNQIATTQNTALKTNLQKKLDNLNLENIDENGEPTVEKVLEFKATLKNQTPPLKDLKTNLNEAKVKIIQALEAQKKLFGSKNKGGTFTKELEELIEKIKESELDEVNLLRLIDDSFHYINMTNKRIAKIYEYSKVNFSDLSNNEKLDLANTLIEAKEFISVYTILEDIRRAYKEADKEIPEDARLKEAIVLRDESIEKYNELIYSFLTDWILPSTEKINSVLKERGQDELTRESLHNILKLSNIDIGYLSYNLGSLSNVNEPGAALIALTLKRVMENIRMQDLDTLYDLGEIYDQKDGNKNNVAEFNSPYLTTISINNPIEAGFTETGSPIMVDNLVKKLAIHTPYHTDKFDKELKEFRESIKELTVVDQQAELNRWYANNTQLINAEELIARKKAELSPKEFDTWYKNNTYSIGAEFINGVWNYETRNYVIPGTLKDNRFTVYSGEFILPSEKYENKKFKELYNVDEYFTKLYDTYDQANQSLSFFERLAHGMLPQIPKSLYDGLKEETDLSNKIELIKDKIKDGFQLTAYDGPRGLVSLSGQEVKNIPVYFIKEIDDNLVSKDLLSSVILFSHMANNYSQLDKVEPYVLMLKDVLLGNPKLKIKPREVTETTSDLQGVLNTLTGEARVKTSGIRINDRVNQFIDTVVYNEREILHNEEVFGTTISLNKAANALSSITALNQMAFNLNAGINNTILGNLSTYAEAIGSKFYNLNDYTSAQKDYNLDLFNVIGDFGKAKPYSKVNLINDYFDSIQGEFIDQFGKRISATGAKRLWNTDTLFFLNNSAEHQIQSVGTIAMLKGKKFTGNKFETKEEFIRRVAGAFNEIAPNELDQKNVDYIQKYNAKLTKYNETRKEAIKEYNQYKESLYEAFEVKKGRLVLQDKYKGKFTEKDRFDLMNQIHALNKLLHGNYNEFDKSIAQRKWIGKLMLMFRKYIYTGFRRRYVKSYVDMEFADIYEGYYRTFFGKLVKDIKQYGLVSALTIKYTPEEVIARKKVMVELATVAACMLILGFLGAGDDDDDELNFAQNHILLQARRLQGDITMFLPVVGTKDLLRIVTNPAVSTNQLVKFGALLNQTIPLYSGGITETYTRKTGIWEKGDLKITKQIIKNIPVAGQLYNFLTPDDQIKIFNRGY